MNSVNTQVPTSYFKYLILHALVGFAVIFCLIQPVQAQLKCDQLFSDTHVTQPRKIKLTEAVVTNLQLFMSRFKAQAVSDKMAVALYNAVKNLITDTTGKRVENKVTALTEDVDSSIEQFNKDLNDIGLEIVDRDKQIEGKLNVTYTEYTRPFAITVKQLQQFGFTVRDDLAQNPNQKITVKIRIRSYGTVDKNKESFGLDDIEFASFTKNRAFVELKFADPSYEGAVFKPQMYFNKEFLKLFGKSDFLNRFQEIKAETLAHLKISEKKTLDQTSVEAMLEFVRLAHEDKLDLNIVAINIYNRVAKSVTITYNSHLDPNFDKSFGEITKAELQMTFDQMIALFVPGQEIRVGEKQYYHAYGPDQTVGEFKTPTFLAHHLKRAQLAAKAEGRVGLTITLEHAAELDVVAPGLKQYMMMIDRVIQKRDQNKELDRGKWGVAIKQVQQDLLNFLKNFFREDATLH